MSTTGAVEYKRKHYYVDKNFQKDFILRFSLLVLMGGLLTVGIVYFLAMQSTTVAFLNSRVVARPTGDFIFPLLVETALIVTFLSAIAGLAMTVLFTHKIAGPLYRFKKVIEAMKQGDLSSDFHIRSKDQFHDLAGILNEMIKGLKLEVNRLRENISALKLGLSGLSEEEFPENKRLILKELKRASDEMDRLIRYFKT